LICPACSRVVLRRGVYLRGYAYDLILKLAPGLTEEKSSLPRPDVLFALMKTHNARQQLNDETQPYSLLKRREIYFEELHWTHPKHAGSACRKSHNLYYVKFDV